MESKKTMPAPAAEAADEELDEVSGGVQAGRFLKTYTWDEFGNPLYLCEDGTYRRADQPQGGKKPSTYL